MTTMSDAPRLDPREEHHRIASGRDGLSIFLRRLAPDSRAGRPVLYVHGATFPSALSVAYRFDGVSWRDALAEAGFDVWALDFLGFGASDRYPEMAQPADAHSPLCRTEDAADQLARAVRFVVERTGSDRVSLISHSWGAMPTCRMAADHPDLIDRLVLFAPIIARDGPATGGQGSAWREVTLDAQWARFVEDVPEGESSVLSRRHFDGWGETYLDSDPASRGREPAAVRIPSGPSVDNIRAFAGESAYDPARIAAPVAIIRGAWDHLVRDADAGRLFDALVRSPSKRDVKIGRGTHLMHLEAMRLALWRESTAFLDSDDVAPVPT